MPPTITDVETIEYGFSVDDVGTTAARGVPKYEPGNEFARTRFAVRIHTDSDVAGGSISFLGPAGRAQVEMAARNLIGENPLHRERIWTEMRNTLFRSGMMGVGPLDIALWDLAGHYHETPIHELLGTYRERLPTYATTLFADDAGGLDSPESFADFAEECLERNYRGFKIHGFEEPWDDDGRLAQRNIDLIHAVGDRVGGEMDLMLDALSKYETWSRALEIGKVLDEHDFLWYEDPYGNGEASHTGHRRLRERLDTPIVQGEPFVGTHSFTDQIDAEAVDILHIDPESHGGITGTMKIAHAAESHGLDVQIHGPGPARRHCVAAIRNTMYYEIAMVHPECTNPVLNPAIGGGHSDAFDVLDSDGTVPAPTAPGLGVEIDWAYIEDNAVTRHSVR